MLSTRALGLEQLGRSTKFLRPNSLFREGHATECQVGGQQCYGWVGGTVWKPYLAQMLPGGNMSWINGV